MTRYYVYDTHGETCMSRWTAVGSFTDILPANACVKALNRYGIKAVVQATVVGR